MKRGGSCKSCLCYTGIMKKINGSMFSLLMVAVIVFAFALRGWLPHRSSGGEAVCMQEARVCPDGSYVGRTGPQCEFAACPTIATSSMHTSNWKIYTSDTFGFTLRYPGAWEKSNDPLTVVNPHVFFGNPMSGTTTYELGLFVASNPQNFTAEEYVKNILAQDALEDASSGAPRGLAPTVTPKFTRQFSLTVGSTTAYELDGVFEYDRRAEQIYIQQNRQMLMFNFPTAEPNPNVSDAVANNAVAHQMIATLELDANIWKFCGGIASGAFPCGRGYHCKLDGNYPDAGGYCVKN